MTNLVNLYGQQYHHKDHGLCSNYCLLSFTNRDFKIISKALAMRLETIIPSIIHPVQTGFIKSRYSSSNVHMCICNIYSKQYSKKKNKNIKKKPTQSSCHQMPKVFNWVNWTFLFST